MVAYSTDQKFWVQASGETRFLLTTSTVKSLLAYYFVSSAYRASKIHMTNSYFLTNNKNFENYIYTDVCEDLAPRKWAQLEYIMYLLYWKIRQLIGHTTDL